MNHQPHRTVGRSTMPLGAALLLGTAAAGQGLGPEIPVDIADPLTATQRDFDDYAWRLFVALNWPTRDGRADPKTMIGTAPGAVRVWESFTDPAAVFPHRDPRVVAAVGGDGKHLHFVSQKERLGAPPEVIDDPGFSLQAASSWPLIDGYGNYAVNEIRINSTLADHIVEHRLADPAVVERLERVVLPPGSIELKAGWRVFPPGWDERHPIARRYHVRRGTIYVTADQAESGEEFTIENALLGLIALHVIQKTDSQPGWIWATFEQVDNHCIDYEPLPGLAPTFNAGHVKPGDGRANRPSLIRATDGRGGLPGKKTGYKWRSTAPYAGDYNPTVVTRCKNEVEPPREVNAKWREALIAVSEDTPWQYYRLAVVQWFEKHRDPSTGAAVDGRLAPRNSAGVAIARNSVLETFLLGGQTLAAQVPAVDPTSITYPQEVKSGSPQGTLADLIAQTIAASDAAATIPPPQAGIDTWSSCVLCHQLAAYTIKDANGLPTKLIPTDSSFLWQTFLKKK